MKNATPTLIADYKRQNATIGFVVDRFWELAPADHPAHRLNPENMPSPHQYYLALGEHVIEFCGQNDRQFDPQLLNPYDVGAWKRLLGAWACYSRTRIARDGMLPTRGNLAIEMKMDASSLTNFLNARRAINLNMLTRICQFLGVKPYDIRPEMGAADVSSKEREHKKSLVSIRSHVDSIIADLSELSSSLVGNELAGVMGKLERLKAAVAG